MKSYYVISSTEGCATNLQENNSYRKDYEAAGYKAAQSAALADVILVNTCAYSQQMETRSTDMISEFKKKYPNADVVVAGCLPKINPKLMKTEFKNIEIKSLPNLVQFSDSNQFDKIDFENLSDKHRLVVKARPIYFAIEKFLKIKFNPLHNIFKTVIVNEDFHLVTASTGCLGKCTFCAIKRAKGSLRSRPMQTIISEFEQGLQHNKKLFWLLGDDIGCWGIDLNLKISDLLQSMIHIQQEFKVVLNYFDPHYLQADTDRLIALLSNAKFIGLNMPIQSGSQRILEKMARNYDLKHVYKTIAEIKTKNPAVAIKTNIIVGFPGETWSDFFKSAWSIRHFDAILALKFTPRPQTPAAQMQNQVPETIKIARMVMINILILRRHIWVSLSSLFNIETVC